MKYKKNEATFKESELKLMKYQYAVSHETPLKFKIGEKVFLKSNPEVVLVVVDVTLDSVIVKVKNGVEEMSFPPQCLLQYKFAGLIEYKRKFQICFN